VRNTGQLQILIPAEKRPHSRRAATEYTKMPGLFSVAESNIDHFSEERVGPLERRTEEM
jgi:hypothetical protein